MMGTVSPLHWAFHDKSGETIVVEPDKEGLHNLPEYPSG